MLNYMTSSPKGNLGQFGTSPSPKAAAARKVAEVFLRRGQRALEKIAASASAKHLAEFAKAGTDAEVLLRALNAGLLAELTDDPLTGAKLRGARMQKELLATADGLTSSQFAETLGVTPQAVNKGRRAGSNLGVPVGEQFMYPYIQIQNGRIVKGLKETLAALPVESEWSKLSFLMGEDAVLGACPIDALKEGRVDETVAAARRYGEHGAP